MTKKLIDSTEFTIRYQFKIILLGDGDVGKTCLVNRYCYNKFFENLQNTIGISFNMISLPAVQNGKKFRVGASIWDFGGQERFKRLLPQFVAGAHGVLLVFDLTNRESLEHLYSEWHPLYSPIVQDVPKLLVGTKLDLIDKTKPIIPEDVIEEYREKLGAYRYIYTSSKLDIGVREMFYSILQNVVKHYFPDVIVIQQEKKEEKD